MPCNRAVLKSDIWSPRLNHENPKYNMARRASPLSFTAPGNPSLSSFCSVLQRLMGKKKKACPRLPDSTGSVISVEIESGNALCCSVTSWEALGACSVPQAFALVRGREEPRLGRHLFTVEGTSPRALWRTRKKAVLMEMLFSITEKREGTG